MFDSFLLLVETVNDSPETTIQRRLRGQQYRDDKKITDDDPAMNPIQNDDEHRDSPGREAATSSDDTRKPAGTSSAVTTVATEDSGG